MMGSSLDFFGGELGFIAFAVMTVILVPVLIDFIRAPSRQFIFPIALWMFGTFGLVFVMRIVNSQGHPEFIFIGVAGLMIALLIARWLPRWRRR